MCTPMDFMHTLSRHSPTACGGIGAMAGIGAGLITDGIGVGMASTLVGADSMPAGAVGTVPAGVGITLTMVPIGVGIITTIIPVIGGRVTPIPHDVLSVYAEEGFHAIHRARVLQAVELPVWQARQDGPRALHRDV